MVFFRSSRSGEWNPEAEEAGEQKKHKKRKLALISLVAALAIPAVPSCYLHAFPSRSELISIAKHAREHGEVRRVGEDLIYEIEYGNSAALNVDRLEKRVYKNPSLESHLGSWAFSLRAFELKNENPLSYNVDVLDHPPVGIGPEDFMVVQFSYEPASPSLSTSREFGFSLKDGLVPAKPNLFAAKSGILDWARGYWGERFGANFSVSDVKRYLKDPDCSRKPLYPYGK